MIAEACSNVPDLGPIADAAMTLGALALIGFVVWVLFG